MLELAAAVSMVALAGWDAYRRHLEARKLDDKAEVMAEVTRMQEEVKALTQRVTQIANRARPKLTGLNR